jgi:hypothetical protein
MTDPAGALKLIGENDDGGWVHVYEYPGPGETLYVVVALKFNRKETLSVQSRNTNLAVVAEVGSQVRDYYFDGSSSSGSAYIPLSEAVGKVYESNMFGDALQVGGLVLVGRNVYVAGFGGVGFGLVRLGRYLNLLDSSTERVIAGSGILQHGDGVVFGTSEFFAGIESNRLAEIFLAGEGYRPLIQQHVSSLEHSSCTGVMMRLVGEEVRASEVHLDVKESPLAVREKLAARLEQLINQLTSKRIAVGVESREKSRRKRAVWAPVFGVLLLFTLSVSVFLGVRRAERQEALAHINTKVEEARHGLDEARSLKSLNPTRAKELVLSAQSNMLELVNSGVVEPQVLGLKDEIERSLGEIAGVYKVDPERYLDLSLVREGFTVGDLAIFEESVVILDSELYRLATVELGGKRTELLAGKDDLYAAKRVVSYGGRHYVASVDGIREVGDVVVLQVKSEDWDINSALFGAFAGNIYVLDRSNSSIYRYSGTSGGFALGSAWLAPGIEPDLSSVVAWSIDGKVWTLERGGRIKAYDRGVPQRFSAAEIEPDLSGAEAIFTSDSTESLYILDPPNSRVVLVNKSGEYVAQYESDLFQNIDKIVVSEENRLMVFGSGSNLYSAPLKHLN